MKQKIFCYLSFGSLAVVIILMIAATVLERLQGTETAFRIIYHNPVFIAFWAVAAVAGVQYLISRKVHRRPSVMALHVSFVLILAGALVTFLFGQSGAMTLSPHEKVSVYEREDGGTVNLPFSLALESFTVETYPGSKMPSDFISVVKVEAPGQDGEDVRTISMNNILKFRGYRFYQADYDLEKGTSILAVSHDPAGVGITYAGYLLLLLSMIGFFFEKDSGFRAALRRIGAPAVAVLLLLGGSSLQARAREVAEMPEVLPAGVAASFGDLYVYYNGRICPLSTQNRDYCLKAYGKAHWRNYDADQVITGWRFYYDEWREIPFKVKAKDRGTAKEREKTGLLRSVSADAAWKIFPVRDSVGKITWYASGDEIPETVTDSDRRAFINKSLSLVEESVRVQDWDEVTRLVGKIRAYQEKTAGDVLPSPAKFRSEKLYNRLARPMIPFMAAITLGMLLFVLTGIAVSRGGTLPKWLQGGAVVLAFLLLAYLTIVLGLRWYVSGHAPFAGSYCVMMLMAWLSSLAIIILWKRLPLILPLGYLVAGFTMLVASLSSANPRITHLMPVLQSPLLSVHVLSMMLSYTLFGLAALNGILGLVVRKGTERLRDVSLVILYPAVFLVIFGIFIGAVWANISWGSYWAWDPKETWALITMLIYAAVLHGSSLKPFRNPRFFHLYTVLAFLSVLMTWFGVNYILGGMHAYA